MIPVEKSEYLHTRWPVSFPAAEWQLYILLSCNFVSSCIGQFKVGSNHNNSEPWLTEDQFAISNASNASNCGS